MSSECDKCVENALECGCNEGTFDLLGLRKNYFIQIVFPEGYMSKPMAICEQIILSSDDVVLNMAAERLAGNSKAIMVLFGLGKTMAFQYEDKNLKELR